MTRKLLAGSVFAVSMALALICGFAGIAAWSDAQHVCPDGNQCSDSIGTMLVGAGVLAVSSAVNIAALRVILPRTNRSRGR
jgi:hypothetical protein